MSLVNEDPHDASSQPTVDAPAAGDPGGFLPSQPDRRTSESLLARIVATAGIVGIATAIGAILGASSVETWIVALVTSLISVLLAAVLWRSRSL